VDLVDEYDQCIMLQPVADRVAKNLEMISKPFQRTRILPIGFTISTR